jgi:hypothetical protein
LRLHFPPFIPFFRHPHLSTLAGNFWSRAIDESRFPTRSVEYPTVDGTHVLVEENRPPSPPLGEVFLQHGLEGSSRSGYMLSLAQALCEAGYAVHRVNMRGCGGSEHLTDSLYHSGLTQDLTLLLRRFHHEGRGPLFLCGFSLGGNVVLKLAGELGAAAQDLIAGVVAVSTPIDLHECVKRLDSRENWLYEQRFVRSLRNRYRRRHQAYPHLFPLEGLDSTRTVFDFDDRFTSKAFGFGDALNYYRTQSALRFVAGIRVPTLAIQAEDDPMIPFPIYRSPELVDNKNIEVVPVPHGGHLGFIANKTPRFWLDPNIVNWINAIRNIRPPGFVYTGRP